MSANPVDAKGTRSERIAAREKALRQCLTFDQATRSLAQYMEMSEEIKAAFADLQLLASQLAGQQDVAVDEVVGHFAVALDLADQYVEKAILGQEASSRRGRAAADALHGKPGGSREKRIAIQAAWASGKYSSRDICAEQECGALGMSFSAARKSLRGTPQPA